MSGEWVCPIDRGAPSRAEDALVCVACGGRWPLREGVPFFVGGDEALRRAERALPELGALSLALGRGDLERLAREFCSRHVLSRAAGIGWSSLLPLAAGSPVLQIGGGFGDTPAELLERGGDVITLVPTAAHAQLLRARFRGRTDGRPRIAVRDDLAALPLADGAVSALLADEAGLAGFDFDAARLDDAAREWRRVLAPGGTLLLGVPNPLARRALPNRLRGALQARIRPETLERELARWGSRRPGSAPHPRAATRSLLRAGFEPSRCWGPLPDERSAEVVLPLDEPVALIYFLDHLVSRRSRGVAAAVWCARLLTRLGLLRHSVPYYWMTFAVPETAR